MRGRCLSAVGAVLAIALFTLAAAPCTAVLRTISENTASATLVIDAGHGREDPGKVSGSGTLEKDINLAIALRLERMLPAARFPNAVSANRRSTCLSPSESGLSPAFSAFKPP